MDNVNVLNVLKFVFEGRVYSHRATTTNTLSILLLHILVDTKLLFKTPKGPFSMGCLSPVANIAGRTLVTDDVRLDGGPSRALTFAPVNIMDLVHDTEQPSKSLNRGPPKDPINISVA